jgi:hypothetical protein
VKATRPRQGLSPRRRITNDRHQSPRRRRHGRVDHFRVCANASGFLRDNGTLLLDDGLLVLSDFIDSVTGELDVAAFDRVAMRRDRRLPLLLSAMDLARATEPHAFCRPFRVSLEN